MPFPVNEALVAAWLAKLRRDAAALLALSRDRGAFRSLLAARVARTRALLKLQPAAPRFDG